MRMCHASSNLGRSSPTDDDIRYVVGVLTFLRAQEYNQLEVGLARARTTDKTSKSGSQGVQGAVATKYCGPTWNWVPG
mgnify:CR=1 FL=1